MEAPDLPDEDADADVCITGGDWSEVGAAVRFDHAVFKTVSFVGAELRDLDIVDCRFEDCDLSGARLDGVRGARVKFDHCRMRGVVFLEATLENVAFVDSMLDDANFRMAGLRWLRWDRCSMRGTDFLAARLVDTRFVECDLDAASVEDCQMKDVVFERGSMHDVAGALHLRGATISPDLAVPVALSLLPAAGITIEPPA